MPGAYRRCAVYATHFALNRTHCLRIITIDNVAVSPGARWRLLPPIAWLNAQDAAHFHICAITLMELNFGILLIERRDPTQAARLRTWRTTMSRRNFQTGPCLWTRPWRGARLHVPDLRPKRDAFIAACALVHGMTIVMRNVADFSPMGVSIINPWAPAP